MKNILLGGVFSRRIGIFDKKLKILTFLYFTIIMEKNILITCEKIQKNCFLRKEKGMKESGYWEDEDFCQGIRADSAGHIFAGYGRSIHRPHGRNNYLLFYVAAGEEIFCLGNKQEIAKAGTLVLFAPGEPQHHYCQYQGTSEFYYVHFTCSEPARWLRFLPMQTSRLYFCSPGTHLTACFQGLIDELQLKRTLYKEVCAAKLTELFCVVNRKVIGKEQGQAGKDRIVHRVIHEINRTYFEPLTLEDYALRFGFSKYHFLRVFKEHTGMSPIAYRNHVRLRHAKEMLEEGDISVTQIAEMTGFSSPQYFCDVFLTATGQRPTEYRKKQKEKLT